MSLAGAHLAYSVKTNLSSPLETDELKKKLLR